MAERPRPAQQRQDDDDDLRGPAIPQVVINNATMDPSGNVSISGVILGGGINVVNDLSCALYQLPNTTHPILICNGATQGITATNWSFAFNNTGLNSGANLLAVVYQTSNPAISDKAFVVDAVNTST
jgi:hypothetical protein